MQVGKWDITKNSIDYKTLVPKMWWLKEEVIMSIATDLATFIQQVGDHVFIEAEGKPSTLNNFITTYNSSYSPSITLQTDGIICLEEDANKWGLELRLYLHFAPTCIHATKNTVYRNDYSYRINDVSVIKELFTLGYRIGLN